jgi:hypothetical protein
MSSSCSGHSFTPRTASARSTLAVVHAQAGHLCVHSRSSSSVRRWLQPILRQRRRRQNRPRCWFPRQIETLEASGGGAAPISTQLELKTGPPRRDTSLDSEASDASCRPRRRRWRRPLQHQLIWHLIRHPTSPGHGNKTCCHRVYCRPENPEVRKTLNLEFTG